MLWILTSAQWIKDIELVIFDNKVGHCLYDVIVGHNILSRAKIDILFSDKVICWGNCEVLLPSTRTLSTG